VLSGEKSVWVDTVAAEANARLCAAAPQMLAALKMVDDRDIYHSEECHTWSGEFCDCPAEEVERAVKNAIKAAEGKKP
jgi:hypothetical protein